MINEFIFNCLFTLWFTYKCHWHSYICGYYLPGLVIVMIEYRIIQLQF